jgi:hypothetical protein
LRPEGVFEGLQSPFFQIDISEIVIHEADEPDAVVDFLDADLLTSRTSAEIDLFAIQTEPATVGEKRKNPNDARVETLAARHSSQERGSVGLPASSAS